MMKVAVVIGRVLDPRGIVVNRRRGRIFVNREEYVMQPADACALEAALRIRDGGDAEVVALPRGLLPDDDVLRQALSAGADRAVHLAGWVANPPYESAAMADALEARVLAAAVERLGGVDLLLTGAATLDTGQGQLGPRLAEIMGWPQVVDAWAVRVVGGHVEAVCQSPPLSPPKGGGWQVLEVDLPAVVTVAPGALRLRYPDGVRLINIYRDEGAVERWDVGDLVDAEGLVPLLEKRGRDFPPERERGVRLEGAAEEMARALADALRKRM